MIGGGGKTVADLSIRVPSRTEVGDLGAIGAIDECSTCGLSDNRLNGNAESVDDTIRVSVVIPTLNEARNLPHVLPDIPNWVFETIIVDGRSTDDTIEVARSLLPDVRIVLEAKKGKGAALRAGFAAAEGDIIVMLDADGSMDPREISAYVGLLASGVDMVKGSRFCQGGGSEDITFLRQLGNMFFTRTVRVLFQARYTDLCYGYSAFWADVPDRLELDGDGFEIETMINVRALLRGLTVAEVPSFEHDRLYGESNLQTFRDGWRVLKVIGVELRRARKTRVAPAPIGARRTRAQHGLAERTDADIDLTEASELPSLAVPYEAAG